MDGRPQTIPTKYRLPVSILQLPSSMRWMGSLRKDMQCQTGRIVNGALIMDFIDQLEISDQEYLTEQTAKFAAHTTCIIKRIASQNELYQTEYVTLLAGVKRDRECRYRELDKKSTLPREYIELSTELVNGVKDLEHIDFPSLMTAALQKIEKLLDDDAVHFLDALKKADIKFRDYLVVRLESAETPPMSYGLRNALIDERNAGRNVKVNRRLSNHELLGVNTEETIRESFNEFKASLAPN